jgi:hypothetical protein
LWKWKGFDGLKELKGLGLMLVFWRGKVLILIFGRRGLIIWVRKCWLDEIMDW